MNFKRLTLAAAVAGAVGLGVAGQAGAYEYGRTQLRLTDLTIVVSDDGGANPGGAVITNFNFASTTTAFLNGVGGVAGNDTCGGLPGAPGVGTNNCGAAGARLDAETVNAPGGSGGPRAPNDFVTFFGPGATNFSNADSLVASAQLTGDVATAASLITESQIQPGDDAATATSDVTSNTGFTFTFTVAGANQMFISTNVLLDILAEINDPTAIAAVAEANVEFELELVNNAGIASGFALILPAGDAATSCIVLGGLACTEIADQFDINSDVSVTGLPNSSLGRSNTAVNDNFQYLITGLTDGTWTLSLTASASTSLQRTAAVPEPGVLALLGAGLAGVGLLGRRRKTA